MPAKYTSLHEPAIRRMLHEDRIAALEKALGLIDVQLMRADQKERRDYFLVKRQETERMLARARRALERRRASRAPTDTGALPEPALSEAEGPVEGTPVPFDKLKERVAKEDLSS